MIPFNAQKVQIEKTQGLTRLVRRKPRNAKGTAVRREHPRRSRGGGFEQTPQVLMPAPRVLAAPLRAAGRLGATDATFFNIFSNSSLKASVMTSGSGSKWASLMTVSVAVPR